MTDKNDALARVMDGSSWDAFCDALKKAGHDVILAASAPDNPLDRAEGFRYLARLTRAALDANFEAADTQAPVFRRPVHETIKIGMDNPDNIYLAANVNGNYTYRIRGKRGSVHYLGFGAQAGGYGKTGSLDTDGYLEAADMKINADGSFEIIASAAEPSGREQFGNWLKMTPNTRLIQVRQTRLDHAREIPADVTIERIDGANQPRAFEPSRVDGALQGAGLFVHGTAAVFAQWAEGFKKHTNKLPRFDPDVALRAGGDPHIAYYHSYFKIADDEALVIELTPPQCQLWNFQLANYWLESLDYRFFPVHLNSHTARYRQDGSVRIVVAKTDPGSTFLKQANWMNTCGRNEGTMCVRWIRAASYPQPLTKLVKLAELRDE